MKEYENKDLHTLILINLSAEEQNNLLSNKKENENYIDKDDSDEKNRQDIIKMLKKEVYFSLLPQYNKELEIFDVFDEKSTNKQVSDLRRIIIKFTDKFKK